MGPAGSTFFGFARTHLLKDEVRPFMYGILVAFIGLGRLSFNSDPVARAGRAIRGLLEHALQLRGGRPQGVCRSRASRAAAATSCPFRIPALGCALPAVSRSRLTRASCVLHRTRQAPSTSTRPSTTKWPVAPTASGQAMAHACDEMLFSRQRPCQDCITN